jgi:hypothetical protein
MLPLMAESASSARTMAPPLLRRPMPQPTRIAHGLPGPSRRAMSAASSTGTSASAHQGARLAREDERAEGVEVIAVGVRLRVDLAVLEEDARHGHGEREIAARSELMVGVEAARTSVDHGIDEHDLGAAGARRLEDRDHVGARHVNVLTPEQDLPRVEQRRQIAAVADAEIELLSGFAGAAADVAALDGDGPEQLERSSR